MQEEVENEGLERVTWSMGNRDLNDTILVLEGIDQYGVPITTSNNSDSTR